jgi:hypothetical protein
MPPKIQVEKTTITIPKKTVTAKVVVAKKEKAIGSIVQEPKIQTAAGWMRSHLNQKKK